ncbi:MAG: trigger factor [Firmicutes bacterium]|nr:trigger factor [Bacillota bacterium]MBQ6606752.1 trigger factor [Bacillota bacterium]
MNFNVTDGEKYQKIVEVEIPAAETELPIKFACKRLSQKVNIPGFRPGKAPRSVLESFVGMDAIMDEVSDDLLPKAYAEALKETGIEPCAQPQVEVVQLKAGEPIKYKFTITAKPEVTLGQYKGLEITRKIIEVTDEDIDRDLKAQQERLTRTEDAPFGTEAAEGDIVVIDFKGLKDGVAFEGGTAEGYSLELGSNTFIPGFEEKLIGAKAGDDVKLDVTFPEDYQAPDLAGAPVVFEVKVQKVQKKVVPEMDQAFVEEVSETAENMEQLREEFRKRLTEQSLSMADVNTRNEAVAAAVNNAEIDVPPVMIDTELAHQMEEVRQRLAQQGVTLEQYLEYTNGTMEEFQANYRKRAESVVRRDLVMEAIVKAEDIQVSDEELEDQMQILANQYWQPVDAIKKALADEDRMEDFKFSVKMGKAADLVYREAVITDETLDRAELQAKLDALNGEAPAEEKPAEEAAAAVEEDGKEAE